MFREKRMYGQDPDVVVRSKPPTFNLPLKLKGSQKVFTCSWSDFFIKEADSWRDEAWDIIDRTRQHTYLILTKRIERALTRLPWGDGTPWPHVWLLVSAEDQETAERRVPLLLQANVAVRGLSAEPLLGPMWLEDTWIYSRLQTGDGRYRLPSELLRWVIVGGESGPNERQMQVEWSESLAAQCRVSGVALFVKQDSGPRSGMQGRIPDSLWARKEFPA